MHTTWNGSHLAIEEAPPTLPEAPPTLPKAPPTLPKAPPLPFRSDASHLAVENAPPTLPEAPPRLPKAPPTLPKAPPLPFGSDGSHLAVVQAAPLMTRPEIYLRPANHNQRVGGKAACSLSKDLRTECLDGNYYNVDLTDGMRFDWKSLIRNMDSTIANRIVGASGIQQMKFRILLNRIDSNYRNANPATPWRHVFEFIRCYGSAIHIHDHKNGTHDAPKD